MKGKRFFTKGNVVIGLVAAALIAASATGVTIFLKDDGEASAAEQQNVPSITDNPSLPVTGNEGENENVAGEDTNGENTTGENTTGETPVAPNQTGTSNNDETTDDENTETEGTTSSTPSREEIVAGIEETTIMQDRKILDELSLSWTTIALSAVSTDMGIYKPELVIEKTATSIVKSGEQGEVIDLEDIEDIPMVRPGDSIIYTIRVSNIGNYKATNVVVTDSLDVIFDAKEVKAGEKLAEIETLEAGKVAILKVAYEVTQEDIDATEIIDEVEVPKNIKNIAFATDGKTTVEDEDDTVPVNPDIENITGTKTWIDNDNAYETRPESITVNLLADGVEVAELEVKPDANGDWKYEFTNLPKYNEDKGEIVYIINEDEVENYTTILQETGYDITNVITQKITFIEGTKTWVIPSEIEIPEVVIELYRDEESKAIKTTGVKEDGTYKFEKLEVYDLEDGHKYDYTVKEVGPQGYTSKQDEYNFTNTIEQDYTISVKGTKRWVVPEKTQVPTITINLLMNNKKVQSKQLVAGETEYEFVDLPKYQVDEDGKYILDENGKIKLNEYTVEEEPIDGYTTRQDNTNFTNVIEQEKITVQGMKIWVVPIGTELPEVTIKLYKDNETVAFKETTVKKDGTYKFEDLDRYDLNDGHEYSYRVEEVVPEGYTSEQHGNKFINTIDQAYTEEIKGTKTWIIPDGTAAPTITINLLRNGIVVDSRELKNGATEYQFTELPKYKTDENDKYVLDDKNMVQLNEYTVEEVIPDEYKDKYKSEQDGNNFTNTKLVPYVDVEKEVVSITKNGDNISLDQKATQGSIVTYTITATNTGTTPLEHFKVTDTRNVKLISVKLPESLKDVTITTGDIGAGNNLLGNDNITVQPEEAIEFTITYELNRNDVIAQSKTFINGAHAEGTYQGQTLDDDDDVPVEVEYTPPYGNKTFVKVWDDGIYSENRPENITVQLMNGNTKVGELVTISGTKTDTNWSYTWNNLPLEDAYGNEINYTVVETEVPGYESSECTVNNDGHLTITNSYDVPTGKIISNWDKESTTEAPVPVDVVFILDTSLSMTQNTDRADNMVSAVNSAIYEILRFNSNNRVAVVGFSEDGMYGDYHYNSSDAQVLLELGRYAVNNTSSGNKSYLVKAWHNKYNGNTSTKVYDVATNVKKENIQNGNIVYESYATRTRYFEQGTYTQAGIKLGAEQLLGVVNDNTRDDTKIEGVQRVPVIILVSDGEPTAFNIDYSNPTINTLPNAAKLGTGQLKNNSAIYGYYTILTANSYKNAVSTHYNGTQAKMFTIAMDLSTHYGKTVLNPNSDNVNKAKTYKETVATDDNGIKDTEISNNLYTYLNLKEDKTIKYSALDEDLPTKSLSVTAKANPYLNNYSYADKAFAEEMTATELKTAMIGSITETTDQSDEWNISDDDNDGLEKLPNIDITGTFTIKQGNTTLYNSYNKAKNDNVVKEISGEYYLNLAAPAIAGKNITVSYRQK